jgi:hypothetical protein
MVQGVGCMVKGVGFGFRLEGVPLEALAAPQELVQGRLQQQDPPMFVIRISGFGFQVRVSRFRFRTRSFGFRISYFRFRVSNLGFRISISDIRLPGVPLEAFAAPRELVEDRLQQQDPPGVQFGLWDVRV